MDIQLVLERSFGVFALAFTLSFVIERALATLFGWKKYKEKLDGKGYKVPIAIATCGAFCYFIPFDLMSYMFDLPVSVQGQAITALFLAGGSKKVAESFGDLKSTFAGKVKK